MKIQIAFLASFLTAAVGVSAFVLAQDVASAQAPEKPAETQPTAPHLAPTPTPLARRGMLPMGFREVITNEQRDKIYEIQQKYRPRMDELEAQIQKLRQEMRREIETVLTLEQIQKVRAREEEIRNRRGGRRP